MQTYTAQHNYGMATNLPAVVTNFRPKNDIPEYSGQENSAFRSLGYTHPQQKQSSQALHSNQIKYRNVRLVGSDDEKLLTLQKRTQDYLTKKKLEHRHNRLADSESSPVNSDQNLKLYGHVTFFCEEVLRLWAAQCMQASERRWMTMDFSKGRCRHSTWRELDIVGSVHGVNRNHHGINFMAEVKSSHERVPQREFKRFGEAAYLLRQNGSLTFATAICVDMSQMASTKAPTSLLELPATINGIQIALADSLSTDSIGRVEIPFGMVRNIAGCVGRSFTAAGLHAVEQVLASRGKLLTA